MTSVRSASVRRKGASLSYVPFRLLVFEQLFHRLVVPVRWPKVALKWEWLLIESESFVDWKLSSCVYTATASRVYPESICLSWSLLIARRVNAVLLWLAL
jgi:hypothetical protein